MKKQSLILIGGGGHCKAAIDVIEATNKFHINGIIDVQENVGKKVLRYKILASDEEVKDFIEKNVFLITVGFIKTAELRIRLFNLINGYNGKFTKVIAPSACCSKYAKVGKGTIVMQQAVVNAEANIGVNCIINNMALIEHESVIGDHSHISTGARINGSCIVGNNCFIGSGTIVNQGVQTVSNVIIGSASLVRKNITEPGVYAGNPLRKIK